MFQMGQFAAVPPLPPLKTVVGDQPIFCLLMLALFFYTPVIIPHFHTRICEGQYFFGGVHAGVFLALSFPAAASAAVPVLAARRLSGRGCVSRRDE